MGWLDKSKISRVNMCQDFFKKFVDAGCEQLHFAFETTLASRTFSTWIPKLKQDGYEFHLIFLWLKNVELAIRRVEERVKTGGHSVPEETIRRRYRSGLKNFFNLYRPLTDSWQFYDNSNADKLSLIASEIHGDKLVIENKSTWEELEETYSG